MPDPKVFEAEGAVLIFSDRAASGFASDPGVVGSVYPDPIRDILIFPEFGKTLVTEGAACVTIDHFYNQAGLGILVMPNWATDYYYTDLGLNSATVCFTSPAPANAYILWEIDIMAMQELTAGDDYIDIVHSLNDDEIPIFLTTNWPTSYWDSTADRTANLARFYFTSPASGTAPRVVWKPAF